MLSFIILFKIEWEILNKVSEVVLAIAALNVQFWKHTNFSLLFWHC